MAHGAKIRKAQREEHEAQRGATLQQQDQHDRMSEAQFRFQDLEIWKRAALISGELFVLSDILEERKLFRFAEQLRGATLSITNNIAEGSGSTSDTDFANFLNMSRRSVFEVANILMILSNGKYLPFESIKKLLLELEEQSRMLSAFRRTLKS